MHFYAKYLRFHFMSVLSTSGTPLYNLVFLILTTNYALKQTMRFLFYFILFKLLVFQLFLRITPVGSIRVKTC